MLNRRFRSIILLSLSLSCLNLSADSHYDDKIEIDNSESSKKNKNYNVINIAKYLPIPVAAVICTGVYLCFRETKYDQILRQDLENDLECDIINYLDGDKISLTRSEIKRYSSEYNKFLSEIDKDNKLKQEKVYDQLRACALFFIRTDARLKRMKKLTYHDIEDDVKRYFNEKRDCILSKKLKGEFSKRNVREDDDYLNYFWGTYYKLHVEIGPSGPWGWTIRFSPKDFTFKYENCKPI